MRLISIQTVVSFMVLTSGAVIASDDNVHNLALTDATVLSAPVEISQDNSDGRFSTFIQFNNLSSSPIDRWSEDPVLIEFNFLNSKLLNEVDIQSNISGSFAGFWDWSWDSDLLILTGVQSSTIPASSMQFEGIVSGSILIEMSALNIDMKKVGLSAVIQPAKNYGSNESDDDRVSVYSPVIVQ